jgi:hypothetical protein
VPNLLSLNSLQDVDLQAAIVSDVWVADGTSKQTAPGRFRDCDQVAVRLLRATASPVVHDVGVSTGVTSLELRRALLPRHPRMHISDKFNVLYFQQSGLLTKIFDARGSLMHAYVGRVLASRDLRAKYFVSRWLYGLAKRIPLSGALHEIPLLHFGVRELIAEGELTLLEYDVFETEIVQKFDYVRCMNVLNLCYFPAPRIAQGLRNLTQSLKPGGILQIGRTQKHSSQNSVGFYRREGNRLRLIEELNGGSELKVLIDEVGTAPIARAA